VASHSFNGLVNFGKFDVDYLARDDTHEFDLRMPFCCKNKRFVNNGITLS